MRLTATLALAFCLLAPASAQSISSSLSATGAKRWFKGNTHAHARIWLPLPHGDSSPKRMARWYKEHGYNFLCLSDHNRIGREERAQKLVSPDFVFLPGSEITADTRMRLIYKHKHEHAPERIVHSTALNVDPETWDTKLGNSFTPQDSVADILRAHREATERAGGIAIANHPNFKGQISAQDLIDAGSGFFEVYNAYPHAKNFGSGARPSTEAMWDEVLSSGRLLYGVASDDAHHTKRWNAWLKDELGIRAPAGGGWIMVRAAELTPAAITAAMRDGDFYASSGVHLERLAWDPQQGLTISVDLDATRAEVANAYVRAPARDVATADGITLEFVTQGGQVAHTVNGPSGTAPLSQLDRYVRGRVTYVADGKAFYAWTQPVFLTSTTK